MGTVRGLLPFCLGATAVLWCLLTIPTFSSVAPVKDIAPLFASNYEFRAKDLFTMASQVDTTPGSLFLHPDVPRAEALIGLGVAEETIRRGRSEDLDSTFAGLESKVRRALDFYPTDSFLWATLYSLRTARYGFDKSDLAFLYRSYVVGPHEGWIALARNRSALAIFSALDSQSQKKVVSEFSEMVNSGFVEEAFANLTGVGWVHRELLLASLESIDAGAKQELARRLVKEGFNVRVPGVQVDERLWQR